MEEGDLAAVGGVGIAGVKLLPLLLTPAGPVNCQDEPSGAYWKVFAASAGISKLPSLIDVAAVVIATSSTKAVLSPPCGFKPMNSTLCVPAVTAKLDVWYEP